jgi:hypothetical protein
MAPGADSAPLASLCAKIYGEHFFYVPFADSITAVKSCTMQEARAIKCIAMHRPYGFHRYFGAPLQNVPLKEDGLFTGRDLIHIALVTDPVER